MCGICGIVDRAPVNREELKEMTDALAHRGPDDEGFYLNGSVGLGHRRLSIIDLEGGKQPIPNEDKSLWVICNGEIYNYRELKKELVNQGHVFRTASDTEVILHLFEDLREGCLGKLSGMFAFAIWDTKRKELFLARDRLGQKPLYYMNDGRRFLFASEVKSILATKEVKREIDFEAFHHYLSLRFIPAPLTMFKGINKVPAAHCLIYVDGKLRINRYWDISFVNKLSLKEEEYEENLRERLIQTVNSHLVSDVPVGAFLSGGMDSSTIVALMGGGKRGQFKTFSVGVKEQDYNELPFAAQVADRYGTQHIERVVEANLIQLLPRMVWSLDEPSDPIAACMYQAANLASEHVKVVLGGDGGDELFAGFDRYLGMRYIDYYSLLPNFFRKNLVSPVLYSLLDSFTYKSVAQKLRWMNQLSTFNGGERYAEATSFFRFSHQEKRLLYTDELWKRLGKLDSAEVIIKQYEKPNAEDPIDKMLYADYMTRLSEHTLMLTDRMNMAHALEARSPFLDHSLVEYVARFPATLKIRKKELKYILKKVGREYLPENILKRQKQGFMFPIAYWLRNELYDFSKNLLAKSFLIEYGLVKKERIEKLLEDHRSNKIDNHVRIWMLLNLEIWHKIFIEKDLML
jgi:asparagine synthase (glutamine-hydrolysing)